MRGIFRYAARKGTQYIGLEKKVDRSICRKGGTSERRQDSADDGARRKIVDQWMGGNGTKVDTITRAPARVASQSQSSWSASMGRSGSSHRSWVFMADALPGAVRPRILAEK